MKVSILIPTRNRSELLKKSVRSVFEQSLQDIECIIVDDFSTDETEKVSSDLISLYGKVRYIKHAGRRNLQAVLNSGLSEAKGEYIARIDDDDLWIDKEKLAKQVLFLDTHPEHFMAGTNSYFVDRSGKTLFSSKLPQSDSELRQRALVQNQFLASTVLFNREQALALGGFPEDVELAGDYGLWLALGLRGKFANMSDFSTAIYLPKGGIKQRRIIRIKDSIKIISRFKNEYPTYVLGLVVRWLSLLLLYLTPETLGRLLYSMKLNIFMKKSV